MTEGGKLEQGHIYPPCSLINDYTVDTQIDDTGQDETLILPIT